jgi:hypothetical protein
VKRLRIYLLIIVPFNDLEDLLDMQILEEEIIKTIKNLKTCFVFLRPVCPVLPVFLRPVCPVLPVFLDCLFLSAPSLFSNVYLFPQS